MTLNLDKHKDALVGAWKDVMDEKNPINWALFGYDGQSFDLNLVSKGDGGLDEMIEDFNSGKIMYSLCRVELKEKHVEKIALINWQGEGAPLSRKGMCANHVGTVRNFFKGVHVTINARTDEDVESDSIIQTVAKATAGDSCKHVMSSNIEADGQIGPVGTCYKRVNPLEEINSSAKDEFWKKEEQEEERRKREEQNKHRKFSQNEVKLLRRESQDYFNDQEKQASPPPVSPQPQPQPLVTNKVNGTSLNTVTAATVKASTPRKNSSGNSGDLVRQRIKSFDNGAPPSMMNFNGSNGTSLANGSNGISNGSGGEKESLSVLKRRQLFESGGASNTTNTVVRKNPAQEIKIAQETQKGNQSDEKFVPTPSKTNSSCVTGAVTTKTESIPPTPSIVKAPSPQPTTPPTYTPTTPQAEIQPQFNHNQYQQQQQQPVVAKSYSPVQDNMNGYNGIIPAPVLQDDMLFEDNTVQSAEHFGVSSSPLPENGNITPTPSIELTPQMGLCARALYDYQAADDSEITFDPGEVITNIERIDEGWWEGLGPRGAYGLFPANYVELLN